MTKLQFRALFCSVVVVLATVPAFSQSELVNYRITYQHNSTSWSGPSDPDFSIGISAIGVEYGTSPDTGFGSSWAVSAVYPWRLHMVRSEADDIRANLSDERFSFGAGLRVGLGYAAPLNDAVRIVPSVMWNVTFSNFLYDFPKGAESFLELTHGPAVELGARVRLFDSVWLDTTVTAAYEPFQWAELSSAPDASYSDGLLIRAGIGVRAPARLRRPAGQ